MTYKKLSEARPILGQYCLVQFTIDHPPVVAMYIKENEYFGEYFWYVEWDGDMQRVSDDDYWMPCPVRSE